jgi:uncharacterized membrane protein YccC
VTADELIETIVERYYEADLPADPDLRLAALRDIVVQVWSRMAASDRVALAAELDEAEDVVGFAGAEPELSEHELRELDEQAVDGLVDRARQDIPELATGDSNQP